MHAIGDAAFDQATRALKAALMIIRGKITDMHYPCLPADEEGIDICEKYHILLPVQSAFIDWLRNRMNIWRTYWERGVGG